MIGSNKQTSPQQQNHNSLFIRGFTLVEVLVATALVGIVMVVATSLLLTMFSSQSQAREVLKVDSNSRQLLTSIGENIVDSYVVKVSDDQIELRETTNAVRKYKFEGNDLQLCLEDSLGACNFSPMNSSDIKISEGKFIFSYPSNDTNLNHPLITIIMKMQPVDGKIAPVPVQASFTSRIYSE